MVKSTFLNDLRSADSEKLIESAYHIEIKRAIEYHGGTIISLSTAVKTDGIIEVNIQYNGKPQVFKLIVETKLNETFHSSLVRSRVLAQVIYYFKKLEDLGYELPNIIFIGDKDECFVLHASFLSYYLSNKYDWTIPPSQAGIRNLKLVEDLINNIILQSECFVYLIDEHFIMNEVTEKILHLVCNIKMPIRITKQKINYIFDYFSLKILKKNADGTSKYSAREQVEFFMLLVLKPDECYAQPKKKNIAVFNSKQVSVNTDAFEAFNKHYKFDYNPEEKKIFTAICDRLIEDSDRRRKGDFYTPTIWVEEANKLITDILGADWKDEYVVWDCAWGTGNLTRDYQFKELYCSTLLDHDLIIGANYNKDSVKFQYDFLNNDVNEFNELAEIVQTGHVLSEKEFESTILYRNAPQLIKSMLNNKKLLFFINPPFGTTGEMASFLDVSGNKLFGLSDTKISEIMKQNKAGACTQQLYAQFIYRIAQISKMFNNQVIIGIFTPTLLFTGDHTERIRKNILYKHFLQGFIFEASDFADVKDGWGMSFSIWDLSQTSNFKTKLKVKVIDSVGVVSLFDKLFYNVPKDRKIHNFYKSKHTKSSFIEFPTFSTAIKLSDGVIKHDSNCFGYLFMDTPRVEYNKTFATLLPSKMKGNKIAIPLYDDNILNCLSLFAARRLITGEYSNWINCRDEYMLPDLNSPLYKQWEADCIIYSLFNSSNNFSSLRGILFKGKKLNIYNHSFFMSKDEIKELSLKYSNDDIYYDIQNNAVSERFIYEKLNKLVLSSDAKAVFEMAKNLVHNSFKFRNDYNTEHLEYQINNWDAGWYQIKGLLKQYMAEDLKNFSNQYKKLEDRMRPLVYELGFLYK